MSSDQLQTERNRLRLHAGQQGSARLSEWARGFWVAISSGVAFALGASTTVGAGFGFGAIGGIGALILYRALTAPVRNAFE
jgi:hypothetical protein